MKNMLIVLMILISVLKAPGTTRLTATLGYIVDNQPFQLNCFSEIVPLGQAASFRMNGMDKISIRYESTLSQCFGTPTSGQSPPFVCANICSCSGDKRTYTWTYIGILNATNCTFTCEMLFGEANSETDTLLVTKAVHPLEVQTIRQVPEGAVIVNTSITLVCSVSGGIPLPNLAWNCSGRVNKTEKNNTTISELYMITRANHNQQVCTCSAFHPVESYRPQMHHKLVVLYPPDMEPVIRVISDHTSIVAGDKIRLSCLIIGGNPVANLSWDCPGNVSTRTDNSTAFSFLDIEVKVEDNENSCSCIATHYIQNFRISVKYIFAVLYSPNVTSCVVTPNSSQIDEFQTIRLRCGVRGNPLPSISWNFNEDTLLKEADNITESSYSINKATCTQSGKYRFLAQNVFRGETHEDSRYLDVYVNCRPHLDLRRPILPKIIAVEVNQTYAFTSYIVAYPKPVINWNKPSSGYFSNLITDGVEHNSTIIVTSAEDGALGEYIMFANNSKGNLFFSFTVVIEGIPTAPFNMLVTCKAAIAFVTWQSEFNGGQTQSFYVKYWNLNHSDRLITSKTVNDPGLSNMTILEIDGLIPASEYNFAIVAINKYGYSTSALMECKTEDDKYHHSENMLTKIGIPVLSAIGSAILVLTVLYIRKNVINSRKRIKEETTNDTNGSETDVHHSPAEIEAINYNNRTGVIYDVIREEAQTIKESTTSEDIEDTRSDNISIRSISSTPYEKFSSLTEDLDTPETSTCIRCGSSDNNSNNGMSSSGYAAFHGSFINDDIGNIDQRFGLSDNNFINEPSSVGYTEISIPMKDTPANRTKHSHNLYTDLNQAPFKSLCEQNTATSIDETNPKTVSGTEQPDEKDHTSVKSVCDIEEQEDSSKIYAKNEYIKTLR